MASATACSTPFDGYARRATPPPDPELTAVGPGTPCGEQDLVLRLPPADDAAADRRLLREAGRRAVTG
ncbi:MAG TPA: hypothetical protein VFT36_05645 [Methylomirabilota bacterium]|nr:hypothetical protein [Methylomirabilota bacterium]